MTEIDLTEPDTTPVDPTTLSVGDLIRGPKSALRDEDGTPRADGYVYGVVKPQKYSLGHDDDIEVHVHYNSGNGRIYDFFVDLDEVEFVASAGNHEFDPRDGP